MLKNFFLLSPIEQFEIFTLTFTTNITLLFYIFIFIFLQIIINDTIQSENVFKNYEILFKFKNTKPFPILLSSWKNQVLRFFLDLVIDNNIKHEEASFPLIILIFLGVFILFFNLSGMLPFSYALTSHIIITFSLSTLVFLSINMQTMVFWKKKTFALFLPGNAPVYIGFFLVPIEILSYTARMFSLAIRLFANIVASHILTKILSGFLISGLVLAGLINFILFIGFHFFFFIEIGIALLQVYIFIILCVLYYRDALNPVH